MFKKKPQLVGSELKLPWAWHSSAPACFNCHSHICLGNIGPGKICSYHEYFSHWPNFDKTFWTQFLEAVISFDQNTFRPNFVWPKLFWTYKLFWTQNLKKFGPKFSSEPKFCEPKILLTHNCLDPNFFGPTFFGT